MQYFPLGGGDIRTRFWGWVAQAGFVGELGTAGAGEFIGGAIGGGRGMLEEGAAAGIGGGRAGILPRGPGAAGMSTWGSVNPHLGQKSAPSGAS
jgi:hypothetical protein